MSAEEQQEKAMSGDAGISCRKGTGTYLKSPRKARPRTHTNLRNCLMHCWCRMHLVQATHGQDWHSRKGPSRQVLAWRT